MSFWAGLARGYADADAKKEREAVRAEAEAARKEATDYSRGRDKIMDERYASQQEAAAAQAAETKDLLERKFAQTAEQLKLQREDKLAESAQQQANWLANFERSGEYNKRDWALTLDKWDYTKAQAKEAQENADRIFNLGIEKFEYGKTRDVVGDLRANRVEARAIAAELYSKERDLVNDDQALNNYNLRMRQFEFQVKRAGVSDEQWEQSFKLQQDAQELNQTLQVWKMLPESLRVSVGGGGSSSGKGGVISQAAMEQAAPKYTALSADLSKEERESDFFKALSKSPGGQALVVGFMEAQAGKSNPVKLSDVPKYIHYLGLVEGKGQKEAEEFFRSVVSGEAMKDMPTLVKGLTAVRNHSKTQHIFMKVDAPLNMNDASKQVEFWKEAVEADAWLAIPDLAPDDQEKVKLALANLKRPEDRSEGLSVLAKYGFGRDAADSLGLSKNPLVQKYSGTKVPTGGGGGSGATVTSGADTLPKNNQNAAGGTIVTQAQMDNAPIFDSWDAVTQARKNGFSGLVSVDGEFRNIPPLGAPAGEAPSVVVTKNNNPPPGTGNNTNEEAFLGTGYIDQKARTALDDMFYDASGLEDSAVEPTIIKRTPKVEEIPDVDIEKGVENLSDIPDTFESPEELEKGVNLALEEIEELGLVFPTTNTELAEFAADLNELVYEMGADIPEPVLEEVVRRATENAKGGLSAKGTLMDANETGRGQGGDPTDPSVGTQLKELAESMGVTTSNLQKLLRKSFRPAGVDLFEAALKVHLEGDDADLPTNLAEFKAFTDGLGITEPDIKKRKRKPEPEPELNRSEISRLQRAVESRNTELVEKLVKKYGEEKIEETLKEMGL